MRDRIPPTLVMRLVGATMLGVLALLPASPASAHSELLESTPAEGATLSEAPSEVQLVFGESVLEDGSSILVTSGGATVSKPNTFTAQDTVASVQLAPGQPGSYTVAFRVVSADGHVVSDTYTYTVTGSQSPSANPTESPSLNESQAAATSPPTDESDDSGGSVVWVLGLGAIGIVLIAALIAVAVRGRRERSD